MCPVERLQKGRHGRDQFRADPEIAHEGRPGEHNQH